MREITHLSLFSGIGGLDLAAEWAGIKTVGQCEWAEYPAKVLEKHWPDIPRWKDIKTLTGESFYERTGRRTVDIISGGFPCQPFSVAGKQRGKEDDRYLWPEMVRVIKELRPTWVIGENVAGIIRMALPDILSELEACGYRTRAFLIPACAVGARHRRYRVAIVGWNPDCGNEGEERWMEKRKNHESAEICSNVAYTGYDVLSGWEHETKGSKGPACHEPASCCGSRRTEAVANANSPRRTEQRISEEPDKEEVFSGRNDEGDVCNPAGQGLPDRGGKKMEGQKPEPELKRSGGNVSDTDDRSRTLRRERELSEAKETGEKRGNIGRGTEEYGPGERRTAESGLGRVADGITDRMDGDIDDIIYHYWDEEPDIPRIAAGIPHRVDRLKALGNMVVPQWAYPIFKAIADIQEKGE